MRDFQDAVLTSHALDQMATRQITGAQVRETISHPDDVFPVRSGRIVAQRIIHTGSPAKDYLLRVFIDIDRRPPQIVTVYRTSKIEKYRRTV